MTFEIHLKMDFSFIAPSNGIKTEAVPILEAPSHCGYSVKRGKDGTINILLSYSSCHMNQKVCDVICCYAHCTAIIDIDFIDICFY